MRVWDADDLMEQVFRTYDRLDEALRVEIPLRRAWVLAEEGEE